MSEAVRDAFPGYRAGVVVGEGLVNGPSVPLTVELAPLDHPHLVAWREAFRALRFAGSGEAFDGGDPPKPGEVVWADEVGVTCRRWNWRQGVRTRLTEGTRRAYFLFDALPELDDASLAAAMDDLSARLADACPAASLSSFVVP